MKISCTLVFAVNRRRCSASTSEVAGCAIAIREEDERFTARFKTRYQRNILAAGGCKAKAQVTGHVSVHGREFGAGLAETDASQRIGRGCRDTVWLPHVVELATGKGARRATEQCTLDAAGQEVVEALRVICCASAQEGHIVGPIFIDRTLGTHHKAIGRIFGVGDTRTTFDIALGDVDSDWVCRVDAQVRRRPCAAAHCRKPSLSIE